MTEAPTIQATQSVATNGEAVRSGDWLCPANVERASGAEKAGSGRSGRSLPPVLDACCGSRMFWFDRKDDRALFVDKRRETHSQAGAKGGQVVVDPDVLANFNSLPFADGTFTLVVFDPPHTWPGKTSRMGKLYGSLQPGWRDEIARGFAECFRVLAPLGTLIFKWNEHRVPVSTVLALTPEQPLFGQRCGTTAKTHWIVFLKGGGGAEQVGDGKGESESAAQGHSDKLSQRGKGDSNGR